MTTDLDDHSRYPNAKATSGRLNQRSAIDTGKNNWGQNNWGHIWLAPPETWGQVFRYYIYDRE